MTTNYFDITTTFNNAFDKINQKGSELSKQMDDLMSGDELNTTQLLVMQFQIGQYNAMIESLSSVTKSMTDMMKNLASRSN